jgi:uncharacterized damage-inducible protein DinB
MFQEIQPVIADVIAENELTRRLIESIPSDKLSYRPHPKGRTAGELAWHLLTGRKWFLEEHLKLAIPDGVKLMFVKAPTSVAGIIEVLDALMGVEMEGLRDKDEYWLRDPAEFMGRDTTLGGIIYAMHKHECHHRGQLSAYLRGMGATVPGVYGGSADDDAG